ncbi:hypothetical protein BOTBODRAFT_302690 [Botryobasidium botryosum FD-172 SS1]|uniref:Uncharacterized protein n=1 Tax=Botryobasidium botryosum (strain FD-172 SS1) TaxID=930990 RepID=A0A067MTC3_BOTB1|nr:hypothetical protein BOTBODRAFT_302690 [Botryobasidium botryosum FD-172 SS1]
MASSLVATLVKDLSHSVDYFNRLHPRQPCSLHRVLSEFESRLAPHTEVSYSPAESATLYQPLDSDSQSHSSSPHSVPSPPLPSTTTAPHIASHAFHAMYTAAWDVAETVVLPLSHYSSLDAACRRYDDHLYGPQTVDAECTSYAA